MEILWSKPGWIKKKIYLKPIISLKIFWKVHEYVSIIHDAFDLRYGVGILRTDEGFYIGNTFSQLDEGKSSKEIKGKKCSFIASYFNIF